MKAMNNLQYSCLFLQDLLYSEQTTFYVKQEQGCDYIIYGGRNVYFIVSQYVKTAHKQKKIIK